MGYGRLKDACNVIMEFDFSDVPVCVSVFGRKKMLDVDMCQTSAMHEDMCIF